MTFNLHRAYRLNPAVALRPERFGALAYNFDNRRLTLLKSPQLAAVVRLLESHDTALGAVHAAGVPAGGHARYAAALAALADAGVIHAR